MSREIKFRAWVETRALNGEPMGFEYLDLYNDNENDFAKFPPKNIEQYTGLKDKNGKEIYEGDIVKTNYMNAIGVVVWNDGAWDINLTNRDIDLFLAEEAGIGVEAIGNIHENPELLGDTNATNKEEK